MSERNGKYIAVRTREHKRERVESRVYLYVHAYANVEESYGNTSVIRTNGRELLYLVHLQNDTGTRYLLMTLLLLLRLLLRLHDDEHHKKSSINSRVRFEVRQSSQKLPVAAQGPGELSSGILR